MNLAGWPFRVVVDGDLEVGAAATIQIDLTKPVDEASSNALRYAVETFIALAQAGGLGGDRIAPDRSTIVARPGAPPSGIRSVWVLDRVAIDARSIVVLLGMLALLTEVHAVEVRAPGVGPRAAFGPDELPPAWPQVPFAVTEDRTVARVDVLIEFGSIVAPEQMETVAEAFGVWLDAGSVQGYRDWNTSPSRSFLIPTEDPSFEVHHNELEARLEDSGILEGGYDVLVNVLTKLHATVPVLRLDLA